MRLDVFNGKISSSSHFSSQVIIVLLTMSRNWFSHHYWHSCRPSIDPFFVFLCRRCILLPQERRKDAEQKRKAEKREREEKIHQPSFICLDNHWLLRCFVLINVRKLDPYREHFTWSVDSIRHFALIGLSFASSSFHVVRQCLPSVKNFGLDDKELLLFTCGKSKNGSTRMWSSAMECVCLCIDRDNRRRSFLFFSFLCSGTRRAKWSSTSRSSGTRTWLHRDLFCCYSSLIYAHWHLVSVLFDGKKEDPQLWMCVCVCARALPNDRERLEEKDTHEQEAVFSAWYERKGILIESICCVSLSSCNDGDGTSMRWQKELVFLSTDHRDTARSRQKYGDEEKTTFFVLDKDRYSASLIDWPNQVIIEPNERYIGDGGGRKKKKKRARGVFLRLSNNVSLVETQCVSRCSNQISCLEEIMSSGE